MATIPTQIRIDEHVKKEATELFGLLGLDMSSAVNMFLNQCILRGGIPFSIEVPNYSAKRSIRGIICLQLSLLLHTRKVINL